MGEGLDYRMFVMKVMRFERGLFSLVLIWSSVAIAGPSKWVAEVQWGLPVLALQRNFIEKSVMSVVSGWGVGV